MYANATNDIISQKSNYSFLNVDPFPFTNANLIDHHNMPTLDDDEVYDTSIPFSKKILSKDEKRAEHNAVERARRESLNSKFQQLAQALPNLTSYRRPSKSQIVEKALEWVKKSISREERYRYQVIQLQKENKQLLAQLMGNPSSSSSPAPRPTLSTPVINNHYDRHQQLPQSTQSTHHQFTMPSTNANTNANDTITNTTMTDIPIFLGDISSESPWLSTKQTPPPTSFLSSSLTSPLISESKDDLHGDYDRKCLDPAIFQSQSTDPYLDTILASSNCTKNKLPSSPGFIQPMTSRSTPAFFSSSYRK